MADQTMQVIGGVRYRPEHADRGKNIAKAQAEADKAREERRAEMLKRSGDDELSTEAEDASAKGKARTPSNK